MEKILFVCLGNICRSPLAHGIAQDYITKHNLKIVVDSCGTSNFHSGESPCINSQKIAKLHNIDISHQKSRQLTQDDLKKFDYIIALDHNNYQDILAQGCPKEKLSKLGFYGFNNQDIPDPYYFNGFDGFEKVFLMIQKATINLLLHITQSTK